MAVFISYSWESKEHIDWVRKLAKCLVADGIEVKLDQWGLTFGQQLPQFMETSIRDNDYVLIICTPAYKKKSDSRDGGVGYEGNIISAELLYKKNYLKFIPVWRSGEWKDAAPSNLLGSFFVNLRADNEDYEMEYIKLRNTLRQSPLKEQTGSQTPVAFDEIKINKVTESLLGRAFSGSYGIRYTDGYLITESEIRDILDNLMRLTRNGGWITILHKADIDKFIDDHIWKNGDIGFRYK